MVAPATDKQQQVGIMAPSLVIPPTTSNNNNNKKKNRAEASKRTITFDLTKNTTEVFEEGFGVPFEEIWFTGDDHNKMKERSRMDAREWRRQGYHVLLNDTFESPRNDVQEYLNAFAQLPDRLNRRGLERQCSRKHGEERSELKENARQSVFRTQEQFKKLGLSPEEIGEKLALCYMSACRNARIFARRMGKADEIEIQRLSGLSAEGAWEGGHSELVERILEQNGILTPDNQRRITRRLSNYSATSVSSFDSQRKYRAMYNPATSATAGASGASHHQHHHHQHPPPPSSFSSASRHGSGGANGSGTSVGSNPRSVGSNPRSVGSGRGGSSVASINSNGRNGGNRRTSISGGPPTGMGEDYYAAIA